MVTPSHTQTISEFTGSSLSTTILVVSIYTLYVLEMRGDSQDKTPEVLVNVWENVGGEMKLTDQKPIKRSHFDTMQQLQDFSYLTNDGLSYL